MATTPYKSASHPYLDLTALANIAKKILGLLAYYSRMRSLSEPNHILNKILTKIITFIHMIEESAIAARIGYQLATLAILCSTEEGGRQSYSSLESMQELSKNGQGIARSVMGGFRDIEQQIREIAEATKDSTFIVVIPPSPTHSETLEISMDDIGTALFTNLDLLTEFSRSIELTAEWWNHIKADLENPNPTLLPLEKGSSDASDKFSHWEEMQQGFQQYHNVVNSVNNRFPELVASSSIN